MIVRRSAEAPPIVIGYIRKVEKLSLASLLGYEEESGSLVWLQTLYRRRNHIDMVKFSNFLDRPQDIHLLL